MAEEFDPNNYTEEQRAADGETLRHGMLPGGILTLDSPDKFQAIGRMARASLAAQEVAEREAGEPAPLPDGVVLENLGGYCPVQSEGTIDGHPFYFRARGGCWSIDVADAADADPVEVGLAPKPGEEPVAGWTYQEPWGTPPAAGWMPRKVAVDCIIKAVGLYRSGVGGRHLPRAGGRGGR